MNGAADLGGMGGFGPVIEEPDEPFFHGTWEKRVMGMVVALGAGGAWNLDQSRFARESLNPATYLSASYYEIWLEAALNLMLERGMLTPEEIDTGQMSAPPKPVKRVLRAGDVEAALKAGGPANRPEQGRPRFAPGQRVRTLNEHPDTHTRLPRYARDKPGTITMVHGYHVFPDSNAKGLGEDPQWLYQVSFEAPVLWGSRAGPADRVTLDLWEPYLLEQS